MMKRVLSLLLCLTMVLGFMVPTVQASSTDDIFVSDGNLDNVIVGDNIQLDNVVIDGESLTTPAEPTVPGSIIPGDSANAELIEKSPVLAEPESTLPAEVVDLFPEGSASETFADGTTVSVDGIPEDGSLSIQEAADDVKEIVDNHVAENIENATELFTYDVSIQDAQGDDWQPTGTVKMELEMPDVKLHKYSKVYVVHVDDNGVATTIPADVTEDGKIAFETPSFSTFAGFTVDFEYNGEAFSIKGLTDILVSQVMDTLKMPLYIEDVANVTFTDETLVSVTAVEGDWLLTSLQAFDTVEELTLTMVDGTEYAIKVTDANFATKADIYVGGWQEDSDDNGECTWYLSGASNELGIAWFGHNWETAYGGSYADGWSSSSVIEIRGPGTFQINLQHQQKSDYSYWGGDSCALELNLYQIKITGGAKLVFRLGADFSGKEKSITIKGTGDAPIFDIRDGSLYFCVAGNSGNENVPISLPAGASQSFFGTGYSKGHIPVYLDGGDLATSVTSPLIYHRQGKDEADRQNLIVEDVTFKNAKHRAVLVQTNNMTNLSFTNCTFQSTVREVKYGGGAIYVDGATDTSYSSVVNVADVKNFNLEGCTFSGNSGAGGHGGAISSYGDVSKLYVKDCNFTNCTSSNRGGAIELSVNDKTAANNVYDWIKFEDTTFTNCTAGSHGGAIDISNGDAPLHLASNLTIDGCTFTNCKATGNRGGAIRMVVGDTVRNLTITDSGFSGCTAGSAGGGISVQGIIGNVTISGSKTDSNGTYTFRNCSSEDHGGALLIDCTSGCGNFSASNAVFTGNTCAARGAGVAILCPTVGNISLSGSTFSKNTAGTLGGGFFVGIRSTATGPITAGDVSVTGCTFSGNKSDGVGACLSLTDGTYNSLLVQNCSFSDSYAANYGGGIGLKVYADDATAKFPVKVTNDVKIYDSIFTNCSAGGLSVEGYDHDGDPATALKTTWDHDGDPTTAEIPRLNGTGGGGAIAIGAEIGGKIEIKSTGSGYNSNQPDTYDMQFINCNTWNNGGAICLTGIVKTARMDLKHVLFDGCRARDAGGAFYMANCIVDNLEMNTCTVQNCSYFDPDDAGFTIDIPGTQYDSLGKALYASYDASGTFRCIGNTTCRALIYNSTFRGNRSYSNGGGIYWNANNIRTGAGGTKVTPALTIQFCNMDGNYAVRDGGALYVEATVNVQGTWFQNNIADGRGGAIAQQVYSNEARQLGAGEATNLVLNSGVLIHNNRAHHGGGISITVSKTVSVPDGTNFIYPVQFQLGGAQVYDNKAIGNGGGIYYATTRYENEPLAQREVDNFQKEILLNNGKIFNNIAGYSNEQEGITSEGGSGGGVYMDSNQITTENSLTDGTKTGHSQVTISSGSIYNNIAYSGNGGGIYLQGKNALCTVTGGTIGFYRDADQGNAIVKFPNKAIPKVVGSTYSLGNGGGIAIYNGGRIEMTGGEICYNEAYIGGGIAVRDGSSMLSDIDQTTKTAALIDSNTATSAGGGVAVHDKSTMTINGGTVTNNMAAYGGGISIMSSGDKSTIGTVDAAGKPLDQWGMIFNGGTIRNNVANGYGGGICLSDKSTMQFNDGTIQDNISGIKNVAADGTVTYTFNNSHEGGGIAVCQGSQMDTYGGKVYSNEAQNGGGLVVRGGSVLNMYPVYELGTDGKPKVDTDGNKIISKQAEIDDNDAVYHGGGIFCQGSTVYISGGKVTNNDCYYGAGGFFDTGSVVTVDDATVTGNEAKAQGGGWFFRKATVILNGGTISNNSAQTNGGGMRIDGAGGVTINGGTISNNKSGEGAGIWIHYLGQSYGKPTVEIYGGVISSNTATGSGGGIFIHGGGATGTDLKMYGGTIKENEAGERGGGINADDLATVLLSVYTNEDGEVTRPEVTLNKAARGGGIFVCYGAELTVNEGFITFNHAVGENSLETALHECDNLVGTGGGIAVATGRSSSRPAKFTLKGDNMAIYGNLADFAADDVFASGWNTVLTIPQVSTMNLAGYQFKPEAWFEDYPIDDTMYTSGLNLGGSQGITDGNVYRYRGASSGNRLMITEADVNNKVNVANTYVCMTLGIPAAVDDTVVIDYGLPVKIDVIDNDVILARDEFIETGILGANAPNMEYAEKIFNTNGIIYGGLDKGNFTEGNHELNNLKHGTAKLDVTSGLVTYQINSNDFTMDSADTFYYAVYHESPVVDGGIGQGYYYYGKVQVIPATTIYFEDNFGTAIDYSGNWKNVGNDPADLTQPEWAQSQDRVGASGDLELDADNVYGFDPVYDSHTNYSFGSAKMVNVSEGNDASAVFTFTGTGFDIISRCNKKSGMILVNVYEGTQVNEANRVTSYMVDTYYGYTLNYYKLTYTYGTKGWTVKSESITKDQMGVSQQFPETPKIGNVVVVYQSKFEPATGSAYAMYQIPVMKIDMTQVIKSKDDPTTEKVEPTVYCDYGTYTVEIYVGWAWWADHEQYGYGSWDFYLDAIRIYNPAGDGVVMDADGKVIDTVVRDAYVGDNEGWPRYEELRNLMISANEFSCIEDGNVSGSIFIDTNAGLNAGSEGTTTLPDGSALSGKLPAIVDYANLGPNNEVYLSEGQGIAFHLDTGSADLPEGVEIASVQIGMKSCNGYAHVKVYDASTTSFAGASLMDLNSATDRYYDITAMDGGDVVIYCESAFTCISITNVKITYTADPTGTGSGSVDGGSGNVTPAVNQIFTISADSARAALSSFLTEEETAPVLTLKYPTLSFEGEICYDIFFDAQNLGDRTVENLGLAVFTSEELDGTVATAYQVTYGASRMGDLFMVSTNGIAAKDMGDRLYFKVFVKLSDGSFVYSDMRSYSAVDYAANTLANSDDVAQKALVVAMLNYGAQAQTFFSHNTHSLMNACLTAEDQALVKGFSADTLKPLGTVDYSKAETFRSNGGFSRKYPAVFFDGAFEIDYNLIPTNAVDDSMTLYCWTEDTYNSVDALTVDNADHSILMVNTDGLWNACSQQIAAKDLDKTVYAAAVYESEGTVYSSGILTYSIAAYCQGQAADTASDMCAFANAAAIYGCAAKAYFG